MKLIRGSNDLGIHRSTPPLQSNIGGASQFVLQVRLEHGVSAFSHISELKAAKGAPNNSPTEPYNPAAYQPSMPSQYSTAFVPQHSQASMQPVVDTDRTRQILELPFCITRFFSTRLQTTLHLRCRSLFFNLSFRIAVVSGIWKEGNFLFE